MTREDLKGAMRAVVAELVEAALDGDVVACDRLARALPEELLQELAKEAHRAREARRRRV